MKVISWNILVWNRNTERILASIRTMDFDILCLQEVPESLVPKLKELPFHMVEAIEVERLIKPAVRSYVVILSRFPISHQGTIDLPSYWERLPLRTRSFVRAMRPLKWSEIRDRKALYADVDAEGTRIRVFNLHLILAHPSWRLEEFERSMAEHDAALPTIVCGDFNIIESPKVSLLNWLLGGKMTDALFWCRERGVIEERFVSHKLKNPLRGKRTHPFSRSQLDHILVSHHFTVTDARVLPDSVGSDHHPISIETSL